MEKEIISDIGLCEKLWNHFSPKTSIWHLWTTAYSFYDPDLYKPHFIRLSKDGQEGLLPLWYEVKDDYYCFFGGSYPENGHLWFPLKMFPDFWEAMPIETVLFDIDGSEAELIMQQHPNLSRCFTDKDFRYSLCLKRMGSDLDQLFERFGSRHRKNLMSDLRKLEQQPYRLSWATFPSDITTQISSLVELNLKRFRSDSDFTDPANIVGFKTLVGNLNQEGLLYTLTASLDKKNIGIEMGVLYNERYHVLYVGRDPEYKGIGKLMTVAHIRKALELGADTIDFLVGDAGWKKLWHLDAEPVYTLRKT